MIDRTKTPACGGSHPNNAAAPPAAMSLSAMALLSVAPLPVAIDAQDWYIQHASLVHDLIYATVTATRAPVGTTGANVEAHKAQQALIRHAALITQGHPPVVVTRDGKHTIAYEELADARAKVKVLTAELDQARRAPAAGSNANWLEEFEWLLHTLLQRNARVAKKRKLVSGEIQQEYDTALRALLAHAQGGPVKFLPEVLDATGKATIGYELYAASRAQARTLQERLDQLKTTSVDTADAVLVRVREVVGAWPTASEGLRSRLLHGLYEAVRASLAAGATATTWHPQFDAMSHQQEQLAVKFCMEIAGPKGQPGSPPDPVRLLEMAEALYQAERLDMEVPTSGDAS